MKDFAGRKVTLAISTNVKISGHFVIQEIYVFFCVLKVLHYIYTFIWLCRMTNVFLSSEYNFNWKKLTFPYILYHTLTSSVLTDAAFSLIILVCQKSLSPPHLLKCIAVSKISLRHCLIAIYLAILMDTQARQHMPTVPELKKWRQDQELEINLNYTGNLRPAWATVIIYQLEKRHRDVLVCFLLCLIFLLWQKSMAKSNMWTKGLFQLYSWR